MVLGSLFFSIFIWAVGLFILYLVIETAVKNGINKSVIAQGYTPQNESKKSFLDHDLDNDK